MIYSGSVLYRLLLGAVQFLVAAADKYTGNTATVPAFIAVNLGLTDLFSKL